MNLRFTPLLKPLIVITLAAVTGGCAINTPFRGPGYDPDRGVTLNDAGDRLLVALTHATLNERRRNFDAEVGRVAASLADRDGLVAYSLRKELLGNEAWTMTVWRDRAALEAFVASSAHQHAIRNSAHELAAARFLRFEIDAAALPISWEDALALFDQPAPAAPQ